MHPFSSVELEPTTTLSPEAEVGCITMTRHVIKFNASDWLKSEISPTSWIEYTTITTSTPALGINPIPTPPPSLLHWARTPPPSSSNDPSRLLQLHSKVVHTNCHHLTNAYTGLVTTAVSHNHHHSMSIRCRPAQCTPSATGSITTLLSLCPQQPPFTYSSPLTV